MPDPLIGLAHPWIRQPLSPQPVVLAALRHLLDAGFLEQPVLPPRG